MKKNGPASEKPVYETIGVPEAGPSVKGEIPLISTCIGLRTMHERNERVASVDLLFRNCWLRGDYDRGGCSLRVVRISSVKTGWTGSKKDTERVGGAVHGDRPTQGISPFEERAGAAEWQTSSMPRNERPSFTTMSVNDVAGARTVNVRTIRRIKVTDLMIKV